jgi:AraC-like DNA-binding protein
LNLANVHFHRGPARLRPTIVSEVELQRVSFSTAMLPPDLPAETKARKWADALTEQGIVDVDCPNPDGFRAKVDILAIGDMLITTAAATSIRLTRTRRHIATDSNHGLMLLLCHGTRRLGGTQQGREVVLRRGDAMLVSHGLPNCTHALHGGEALSINLSRAALANYGIEPEAVAAHVIDRTSTALQLLVAYAGVLLAAPPSRDSRLALSAASHLSELAALAIADAKPDQIPAGGGASGARLALVLSAIADRACEPGLDAAALGLPLGLSARGVQHLLQQAGTTFTAELRAARLGRAEALLRGSTDLPMVEIAHASGFLDLSTFYRAFRARGGASPAEIRLEAKVSGRR